MSKAAYRNIRGINQRTATSQFLAQMPHELLEIVDRAAEPRWPGQAPWSVTPPSEPPELGFRIGQRVRHPAFGLGRIVDLSNSMSSARAVVEFERAGRKTLVLEHAKLTPA